MQKYLTVNIIFELDGDTMTKPVTLEQIKKIVKDIKYEEEEVRNE